MSDSLNTQIRDYFTHVDEAQGTVDIALMTGPEPVQALQPVVPAPPRRGRWAVGLTAAAAIAALVTVPLLFIAFVDKPDVATTVPPTTTEAPVTTTAPEAAPETTQAPTTTTVPETTTTLPAFPPIKESLSHGGEAWAVYIAAEVQGDLAGDLVLGEAAQLLLNLGFRGGGGDLGCDQGARELLGLDPELFWHGVGMYFETEADAQAFVVAMEARGHSVLGWGLVYTYCMD